MTLTIPSHARILWEGNEVRIEFDDNDTAKVLYDELEAMQPELDEAERLCRRVMMHVDDDDEWSDCRLDAHAISAIDFLRTELARRDAKVWNEALAEFASKMAAHMGLASLVISEHEIRTIWNNLKKFVL